MCSATSLLELPGHLLERHVLPFLAAQHCFQLMRTNKQLREHLLAAIERYISLLEFRGDFLHDWGKLGMVMSRMQSLARFHLFSSSSTQPVLFPSDCAPRLRVLELVDCNITDVALREVAEHCPGLQRLVLANGIAHPLPITDLGASFLATSSCGKFALQSIQISGAPNLTTMALAFFMEHCAQLTQITLSHCSGMKQMARGVVDGGAQTRLLKLDLSHNSELRIQHRLGARFQSLRGIDLCGCLCLDDAALVHVALSCPHLSDVSLAHCVHVTDFGLKRFFSLLQSKLERFNCSRCVAVGDASLITLCQNAGASLRALDCQNCHRITNRTLFALGEHCANIETLLLRGMEFLDDAGIEAVCTRCAHLQDLSLASCPNLTSDALQSIAKHCGRTLRRLDLFCLGGAVLDESLRAVAASCVGLDYVCVSWCFHLSPDLILAYKRARRFKRGLVHDGIELATLPSSPTIKPGKIALQQRRTSPQQQQQQQARERAAFPLHLFSLHTDAPSPPLNEEEIPSTTQVLPKLARFCGTERRRVYGDNARDHARELAFARIGPY